VGEQKRKNSRDFYPNAYEQRFAKSRTSDEVIIFIGSMRRPLHHQGTAQIEAKAAQSGFYHHQGVWLRVNLRFYGK
jgi:hypothetical protein